MLLKTAPQVVILWNIMILASFRQRETPEMTLAQGVAVGAPARAVTCLTTEPPPVEIGQIIDDHSRQSTLQGSHMFKLDTCQAL